QAAADPNIDHRADIYAVGVLAYEMLAGQAPFTGGTAQQVLSAQLTQAPEALTVRRPAVPPALAELVMKALEKNPGDRWQSASELLARLEAVATPSGGTMSVAAPPRNWKRLTVIGAVVVAALGVVGWQLTRSRSGLNPNHVAVVPFVYRSGADSLA